MKKLNLTIIAAVIAGMCGSALAAKGGNGNGGGSFVIDDDMSRRAAGSTSGSGDTVVGICGDDDAGNAWQDATAHLTIDQKGGKSSVTVDYDGVKPNTHFTVWLRIKGGGDAAHVSPWTGGGATPLCSGTEYADLLSISPGVDGGAGDTNLHCNSFNSGTGTGSKTFNVNFPVVGGAYPFQQSGQGGDDIPTAIIDPRTGNGGPFMIRVISHCSDNSTHGLSPYNREAWFQYP